MMRQNEATVKRCRHITAGVSRARPRRPRTSRESYDPPLTIETSAPPTTFMKQLLCAVVLITGTGVFADDTMKTAGEKIDKAAAATKGTVKKAASEVASASKKVASDVSSAAKK